MIRCLIIDDEPLARQLLEGYASQVQGLTVVAACKSAVEAFSVLHEQVIDLMFLDINMPGITGLNFLKSLSNPPAVIFTTAYAEYAVEAFEMEAVDYLLKPVTPERFLKAVRKVMAAKKTVAEPAPAASPESIFVKIEKRLVKVDVTDILYAEALGDYVKIHTTSQLLITHSTITKIEALLPADQFVRIHRSFIAAIRHIRFIEGNFARVGEAELPIGATYRDGVLRKLEG